MPEKTPSIHEWPVRVGDYVKFKPDLPLELQKLLSPEFDPTVVCTVVQVREADNEGPSVLYLVPGKLSSSQVEKNIPNSLPVSIEHLRPVRAH